MKPPKNACVNSYQKPEIDFHALRLLIGIIALLLASVTDYLSLEGLKSISEAYHIGGWSRDFFVGSLFAISAFLFAYNGKSKYEFVFGKVASLMAIIVALFHCKCGKYPEIIPYLHYIAAGILFSILIFFCFSFRQRAMCKPCPESKIRAKIYLTSAIIMMICMAALLINFRGEILTELNARFVFWAEKILLICFGVSWLTASQIFPFITNPEYRYKIFKSF